MQVRSLAWWGLDRIVLSGRQEWEVRSWPEGVVVDAGDGLAIPESDGRRWAVATPKGVKVDGVCHALPGPIQPRAGCWWRDGVCVTRTDPRGGGPVSELWWVTAAQGPVRLLVGMPGRRFVSIATTGDDLFVAVYTDPEPETAHTVRVLAVNGVEDARDAVPDLSGSVHQMITMSERRRVVLWSEDPNLTQQVLIEGDHGWETLAPELRVAGPCQRIDARELLIPAYDGIRAGMIVTRASDRARAGCACPQGDASWRWALRDPVASFFPLAVNPDGDIAALRRPVDGTPTLVSVKDATTRDVVSLPNQNVSPARVQRWTGPVGPLEGLVVTPPGTGPWPVVVDVHGGPNHTLVAGFDHDLDRWRQAGFAALAPEYAAAGIGGSQRRSSAWLNPGPPSEDPNVADVASAIAAAETKAIATNVFLFGWSWGGFVVNRLVSTGTPYGAAACWEGGADHRILDARVGGDPLRRTRWGTPAENRDAWEQASPVTRAAAVRTPMLLLYGEDGCPEQGEAWHDALYQAGVPAELWIYPGGHIPAPDVIDEIYRRAAAWFRRWDPTHRNG